MGGSKWWNEKTANVKKVAVSVVVAAADDDGDGGDAVVYKPFRKKYK